MTADVVRLHAEPPRAADTALAAIDRYLNRCGLADHTVKAYRRQCAGYVAWLAEHAEDHPDAFTDQVGADAAVTSWRRHLLRQRRSPATVNQALAAVTLMYEHAAQLRVAVKRARVPRPGEPDALTERQQGAVTRAADRRSARDAALVAVLLYTGARVEECARLDVEDVALTTRTGDVRLLGKGDQVRKVPLPAPARDRLRAWFQVRGAEPGPLWTGQRGRLTTSGITKVILTVGQLGGVPGLRPHRLRHTYATRLRQRGVDPAQVQALLGHAHHESTARYYRAGSAETADAVERAFET